MADEYTPTTEQVREAASLNGGIAVEPNAFNRWLAAHDRETAARAWDEGFRNAEEQHDGYAGVSGWTNNNPYREGDST